MPINISSLLNLSVGNNITLRDLFSAGLILPLNVAVGFVVCCTMYSFYMYFRRGEL